MRDPDRPREVPSTDPPRIPGRGHYTESARLERLRWARQRTGTELLHLESTGLTPERLTGNIENLIGGVEVPVGLAGPLWFRGRSVSGLVLAPFATTEGSLVASATRGATALSRSGGVTAQVLAQRMLRVPLFVLSDLDAAYAFASWVESHQEEIRAQTLLVSGHAELRQIEPFQVGNMVHLRFIYETGDAAGQNMTTACTWKA
ncbi:MAG: hydroxymethylglutaryl-CoA reductase, partial [bacterium]|nr:hydroxymethylglutaryl-CoA reductase [bacterium]